MANSSIFVLPTEMQPAFSRLVITVAEYGGTKLDNILEPHVVLRSLVQNKSFWAIGIPDKVDSTLLLSSEIAFSIAESLLRVMNAFRSMLDSINEKVSLISSSWEISLLRSIFDKSLILLY